MAARSDLLTELYEFFEHSISEITMIHSLLSGYQSDSQFPDFFEISEHFRLTSNFRRNSQGLLRYTDSRSRDRTQQVPDSRISGSNTGTSGNNLQERFPVFQFSGPRELECLVCYGGLQPGQNVKALSCLHIFHQSCIDPWLETENTCPVCRYDLTKIVDIHKL